MLSSQLVHNPAGTGSVLSSQLVGSPLCGTGSVLSSHAAIELTTAPTLDKIQTCHVPPQHRRRLRETQH